MEFMLLQGCGQVGACTSKADQWKEQKRAQNIMIGLFAATCGQRVSGKLAASSNVLTFNIV